MLLTSQLQTSQAIQRGWHRMALAWWACVLGGIWLLANPAAGLAQSSVSREYQIKAAYLYNFAKFVEWPSESFTNSDSPLVIGVFGPNPFGQELEIIAKDHQINGRPIVVKMVNTVADTAGVHLLFVAANSDSKASATLAALENASILTVGESEKFVQSGGIIDFVRQEDKVRFEINATAAERHGLKISAQLLKLATAVRKDNQPQP